MPQYLHPGVYVQEVPSAVQPIAGVGTSTAGFIGVVPDTESVPLRAESDEPVGNGDGKATAFDLKNYPVQTDATTFTIQVAGKAVTATLVNDDTNLVSRINFASGSAPADGAAITASYRVALGRPPLKTITGEAIGTGDGSKKTFNLAHYPVLTAASTFQMRVAGTTMTATLSNDDGRQLSQVTFGTAPPSGAITGDYVVRLSNAANNGEVKLCTSFTEFKTFFGDFSTGAGQRNLVHAVYGFFNNGGTRCYVVRIADAANIATALTAFEAIDEIAIVAAPGVVSAQAR